MKTFSFLVFLSLFSSSLIAQNPLSDFEFLVGNWQGVESGVAGDGIGFRTYTWQLGNNYIMHNNASHFPKAETKPKGEVHRDFGILSFNKVDSSIILREYHVEGFVNIYKQDKESSNDSIFIFITREIENNPGNWVARSTYKKISDNEFIENFEIAMDGKNFKDFLENHWYKTE